jgi:hypothetical protein
VKEGMRVQLVGGVLAVFAVSLLAFTYSLDSRWGAGLAAAMLAELVTGREAAIPLALVAGTPPVLVALTSIAQNLAVAAILVPLARQSMEAAGRRNSFAARFMFGLQESALERVPKGRSAWALFAFMLVPFVANGPILAGCIGVMAGLPARRLAAVVVAAVVVTATAWTYAYATLTSALSRIDERLALVPAVLAAVFALAWLGFATRRALATSQAKDPEI